MTRPRGRPPKNKASEPGAAIPPSPVPAAGKEPPKTDNVITAGVPEGGSGMIKVETNGSHQLHDPVTNATIPHDKAILVDPKNPFIQKMLKRAKNGGHGLKEVK